MGVYALLWIYSEMVYRYLIIWYVHYRSFFIILISFHLLQYAYFPSQKKIRFNLSCIYVKIHIHVYTCLFWYVQYTYPYLYSVYLLSQTKGDGQRIYETDETSYHVLFQGFKNSSTSNEGNTFSVSIYNDGSIRQRYHR
jgi:hypothetical protein